MASNPILETSSSREKLPPSLRKHRYPELLSKWWHLPNTQDGILTIVVCGKRGSGKSWVMLTLGALLDRTPDDKCTFSVDKVSFKASEFLQWLNKPKKEWKKGSVICLDDAGIHMYNRESLTNFIKTINKTLQNIRYKHPIVILTLPSFQMLDKHARDMSDIYIEVVGRDAARRENLCKIQELAINPYVGNLLRMNIGRRKEKIHPTLNMFKSKTTAIQYRVEAPPGKVVREYENKKARYLDAFNIEGIKRLQTEENRSVKKDEKPWQDKEADDIIIECLKDLKKYVNEKGRISEALIRYYLKGARHREVKTAAQLLTTKIKKGELDFDQTKTTQGG